MRKGNKQKNVCKLLLLTVIVYIVYI